MHGGIIGATLFIVWYSIRNKFPIGRIIDFSLYALLAGLSVGLLLNQIFLLVFNVVRIDLSVIIPILYIGVFIFFTSYLLKQQRKGQLKDGTIGLLFLITYSIFSFVSHLLQKNSHMFFEREDILLLMIVIVASFFIIKQNIFRLKKSN